MKKLLSIFALVLTVFLITACGSSSETDGDTSGDNGNSGEQSSDEGSGEASGKLAELREAGVVKIGFANEKPYAYQDENGELKGEAVAIAKAVFKELGVEKVDGQLADFSQLIAGVQAGKFDVATAGMAITPKRCKQADFGEPEIQYGEGLIVQEGNPLDLHSYQDIADNPDVTVSVMSGATEIGFLKEMGVSEDQISEAPDIPATFAAVQSGRADATTGTEMTIKMALESSDQDALEFVEDFEQPDIDGVPSYGAAVFHQDNDDLREAYNKVLQQKKEDGEILDLITPSGFSERNLVPNDLTTEELCQG
ncbi:ectoine/hydroxyectoine ABC transporter substrate-binding protein EhuB [Virgibacillus sp. MSP4-1]|uniref:ectoine/hydroxyectoine ABC transporter substrate-binding protein EhuB n=1 Tax=Virgibacillus sp. MSP4-1 TaxID=2700081 RepID=UPI00039E1669|nr:ectoine/hydroxyectoine ABC transporter substrate-binding protein EhuB [Virgibacillus sp. MSP4-1]QHS23634.1 ectoine/hydroxyectoine ABC transporter substrate-binding protein EhuB [Virgibacillus sp. MSP4-1]